MIHVSVKFLLHTFLCIESNVIFNSYLFWPSACINKECDEIRARNFLGTFEVSRETS